MTRSISVSIIIPAFNEEAIIKDTLRAVDAYVGTQPQLGGCEIVVVAAGSDRTAEIAKVFHPVHTTLEVVTPARAEGKGRDVQAGFRAARGALQLFTDADLSTPLHHIAEMVELLRAGNDIVVGRRRLDKIHPSRLRSFVSVASNRFVRTLILPGIGDSQCGFKGFTAQAAKALFGDTLEAKHWAFDIEVLAKARRAGYGIAEMPINDWHETRQEDLRGERLGQAALGVLKDVLALRVRLWEDNLARHAWPIILSAALASAGLALCIGSKQSVWFDEGYTILIIKRSIPQLIHLTSVDVHPPLYYLILKGWAALWGGSDIALRSFSALCGGLSVVVGLLLVKRLWNARVAVMTAPFAVAAPFFLRYGFEIRMYALATLIGLMATYVLVAAFDTASKRRHLLLLALYATLVAAGMYTLYHTIFFWLAHFIWGLYVTGFRPSLTGIRRLLRQPWAWAYPLAIALLIPWLLVLASQMHAIQAGFWISPPTYHTIVTVWSFFFSYLAEWQLDAWQSLLFIGAVTASLYFVITAFRTSDQRSKRGLVLLLVYLLTPIVCLYLLSLPPRQPIFVERYESQAILAGYLLLGAAISLTLRHRRKAHLYLLAIGLLAVCSAGVIRLNSVGNFNFQRLDISAGRQITAFIRQQGGNEEPIIADGPYMYIELYQYLGSDNLLFYSAHNTGTGGGYAPLHDSPLRVTSADTFPDQAVWQVVRGDQPPYIPTHHALSLSTSFGKYNVHRYDPVYINATR